MNTTGLVVRARVILGGVVLLASCTDAVADEHERVAEAQQALSADTTTAALAAQGRDITIASLPYAACTVRLDGADESMPVWADDEGLVHLSGPLTNSSEIYAVDCDESGKSVRYNYDLAAEDTFTPAKARVRPVGRKTLAALTDPNGMTQEEITAAGYPPRPDKNSPYYEQWLKTVSTPSTLIAPHDFGVPDMFFDPGTSQNDTKWSALVLTGATRYTTAISTFTVPTFGIQGSESEVAMWIGLDGAAPGRPIIQAGVFFHSVGNTTSLYPWYEYYGWPSQPQMQFVIHAGDSIQFDVFECGATGLYGPTYHGYGCFWWHDNTRNTTFGTAIVAAKPGFPAFDGRYCEGVIERKDPTKLVSSFSTTPIIPFDCWVNGGFTVHNVQSDPYANETLVNASNQPLVSVFKSRAHFINNVA